MRRGVIFFLVALACFLIFAVNLVWTLLTLLFVDGSEDAISKAELPAPGSSRQPDSYEIIPRILHQTYQNDSIPDVWREAQQSCKDIHKPEDGWEYILWTDEKMDSFIEKEYPWFLDTFKTYSYPIMRADAIRYFVLSHFGGVYLDLDDGCQRSLDPLLTYPAWVRKTIPTGISNDAMGSTPGHPFFRRVVEDLQKYNKNWILPYITVMASTGPLFLSIIWRHYSAEGSNVDDGRIRILWVEEYQGKPWSFFTHHMGNSWHGGDVQLIFWVRSLILYLAFPPTDRDFAAVPQLVPSNSHGLHNRRHPALRDLVDISPRTDDEGSLCRRRAEVEDCVYPLEIPILADSEGSQGVRAGESARGLGGLRCQDQYW